MYYITLNHGEMYEPTTIEFRTLSQELTKSLPKILQDLESRYFVKPKLSLNVRAEVQICESLNVSQYNDGDYHGHMIRMTIPNKGQLEYADFVYIEIIKIEEFKGVLWLNLSETTKSSYISTF